MPTVNEVILNRAVRHAIYIERYKTKVSNDIMRFLARDVYPDLKVRIDTLVQEHALLKTGGLEPTSLSKRKLTRLKAMRKAVDAILSKGLVDAKGMLRKELTELALTESAWQTKLFESVMPIQWDITSPPPQALRTLVTGSPIHGKLMGEWFMELTNGTQKRVMQEIRIGFASGESIPNITKRLTGKKALPDMLNRHVTAIVRTSVTHVANSTRELHYEENNDLVKAVQYVATLDSRTTIECASLDGEVFPINEGPRPPIHMQCRSTTIPILTGWKELGLDPSRLSESTRASMTGQEPSRLTYSKWLRQQPETVQNDVLGKGRAELFRGGMPIDRMTNEHLRPLSLLAIRRREGIG